MRAGMAPLRGLALAIGVSALAGRLAQGAADDHRVPPLAYVYHDHGWSHPDKYPVPTKALRHLIIQNPTWTVVPICKDTWHLHLADPPDALKEHWPSSLPLVKLALLYATGGVWLDHSVLVKKSMKSASMAALWSTSGFFAHRDAQGGVSSQFIVASMHNPLLEAWHNQAMSMAASGKSGYDILALAFAAALKESPGAKACWETTHEAAEGALICQAGSASSDIILCAGACMAPATADPTCKAFDRPPLSKEGVDLTKAKGYLVDRRYTVPEFKQPGGRLFFVHVPKTGGTAIEDAARTVGFAWGRFDRHYDGHDGDGYPPRENRICGSAWHEPYHYGRRPGPQQVFCSIREPIDHLLSEFNFRATDETCNDEYLQTWVKQRLEVDPLKQSRHKDDCHLLPSVDYAHSCDYLVPWDDTHKGLGLLMRVRFNITFVNDKKIGGLQNQVLPIFGKKKCRAKPVNLTSVSLASIHKYFAKDFKLFRQARKKFIKLIRGGMVSPQIPDLCPKSEECKSGNDKDDATCACVILPVCVWVVVVVMAGGISEVGAKYRPGDTGLDC